MPIDMADQVPNHVTTSRPTWTRGHGGASRRHELLPDPGPRRTRTTLRRGQGSDRDRRRREVLPQREQTLDTMEAVTHQDSSWPAPPVWRGEVNIEPLTSKLAALDTVAYIDSPDAIRRHSAGRWPIDGFTMAENLTLIATHEAEHDAGVAFAYSLLNVARDRELGCVYLRPLTAFQRRTGTRLVGLPRRMSNAAIATFWLIDDAHGRPTAVAVVREVESWVTAWGAAPAIFRCLPQEAESIQALVKGGLVAVDVEDQELPYRWFMRA